MQREIKDYFYFSKNEKRGIFLLCLLILLTFFIPRVYSLLVGKVPDEAVFRQLEAGIICFPGEDVNPEDSMPDNTSDYRFNREKYPNFDKGKYKGKNFQEVYKPAFIIEINSADSLDLLSVPGIGPFFSLKILRYREKLGGYFSVNQLLEIKGMDPGKLKRMKPYFRVDTSGIRKIPLNTVDFKVLLKHPYSNYQVAKAIVKFRQSYGTIQNLDEIRKSGLMPDSLFIKLKPYLSLQ
jgi:DNA uptake protein ComE-like DNA-binding protein